MAQVFVSQDPTTGNIAVQTILSTLDNIVADQAARVVYDEMVRAVRESPEFRTAVANKMAQLMEEVGAEIVLRGLRSLLEDKQLGAGKGLRL